MVAVAAASTGNGSGSRLDSTIVLLARARGGDDRALDILFRRYEPALRVWAHGRIPGYAGDLMSTDDLVQKTLLSALNALGTFEPRRDGAFLAWLRTILWSRVYDARRKSMSRPASLELAEDHPDSRPSPIEQVIGRERLAEYEEALDRLTIGRRAAVILWVEFGFTYEEIGTELGIRADTASKRVRRGLSDLADEMGVGNAD